MTNNIFYIFFVFVFSEYLIACHTKKYIVSKEKIEVSGHFYRHIPYYIRFPSHVSLDSIEINSKYVSTQKESYDTLSTIFRFTILEEAFSSLDIYTKSTNNVISIKPSTSKHPPVSVELKLDKYYRSGDTILIKDIDKGGLAAEIINFDIGLMLSVKEFNLLTIYNGILKTDFSEGSYLTTEQINSLKSRDKKTPIIFSNIIIKSINEDIEVNPLVFFVKDE